MRKPIYHKYIYGLTNQISRFNDLFRLKDNRWIIRIYVDKSPFTMRYSQREEISGVDIHKEKQIFDEVFDNLNRIKYVQIIDVNCQYRDEDITLADIYHRGYMMTFVRFLAFFDNDIDILLFRDLHRTLKEADRDIIFEWEKSNKTSLLYIVPTYIPKHIECLLKFKEYEKNVIDFSIAKKFIKDNNAGLMAAMFSVKLYDFSKKELVYMYSSLYNFITSMTLKTIVSDACGEDLALRFNYGIDELILNRIFLPFILSKPYIKIIFAEIKPYFIYPIFNKSKKLFNAIVGYISVNITDRYRNILLSKQITSEKDVYINLAYLGLLNSNGTDLYIRQYQEIVSFLHALRVKFKEDIEKILGFKLNVIIYFEEFFNIDDLMFKHYNELNKYDRLSDFISEWEDKLAYNRDDNEIISYYCRSAALFTGCVTYDNKTYNLKLLTTEEDIKYGLKLIKPDIDMKNYNVFCNLLQYGNEYKLLKLKEYKFTDEYLANGINVQIMEEMNNLYKNPSCSPYEIEEYKLEPKLEPKDIVKIKIKSADDEEIIYHKITKLQKLINLINKHPKIWNIDDPIRTHFIKILINELNPNIYIDNKNIEKLEEILNKELSIRNISGKKEYIINPLIRYIIYIRNKYEKDPNNSYLSTLIDKLNKQ